MSKYIVIWTYVANYGKIEIHANSPEEAANIVFYGFSEDFRQRGTCYVVPQDAVSEFGPKQRQRDHLAKLERLAQKACELINQYEETPSMGYDDPIGIEYHLKRLAEENGVSYGELQEAISDLYHANDGPYGRNE